MRLLAAVLVGLTIAAAIVCGWIADAVNAVVSAAVLGLLS